MHTFSPYKFIIARTKGEFSYQIWKPVPKELG